MSLLPRSPYYGCMATARQAEPSLAKEIGSVAWLMAKILAVMVALATIVAPIFPRHPLVAYFIFLALLVLAQMVFYGWMIYDAKKEAYDRKNSQ